MFIFEAIGSNMLTIKEKSLMIYEDLFKKKNPPENSEEESI